MVERDTVRRWYDSEGESYDQRRPDDSPDVAILDRVVASLTEPGRILDAGCGGGRPVLRRLDAVTNAVGLDLSRGQLRAARATVPGAALAQGDLTVLPFADETFDAVIAFWSLIHVPKGDHARAVEEFARVLVPGGHLLLCEGTNEWTGTNRDWLDSGTEMQWNIAGADATQRHLENAGFAVRDAWRTSDPLDDGGNDVVEVAGHRGSEDEGETLPWTFFSAQLEA